MADIERISAQQAHTKTKSNQALLVCAYEDEAKCRMFNLEGSISFASFKSRLQSLPKSQEIIFYWAWPGEASAVGQAAKYRAQGFKNVTVLKGGVDAWKAAGYAMNWIGNRLKELRESKNLSQGDVEKRTGLLRCYISRVENGHTVPAVETLEKMARALELPMYRLFHDGEVPTSLHKLKPPKDDEFGSTGKEADYFAKLRRLLAKMGPDDQKLLLYMAQKVARD